MSKSDTNANVTKVYNMLTPKPKQLLENPNRKLVRHGELIFFSTNTMSTKPRYFFLFSDCLLITKRTGNSKFLLRLWLYLKSGVQLYSIPESTNYEFRLLVPVQGSVKEAKKRRLIIHAKSEEQKQQWVDDLAHLLWACTGKKGPDPSKGDKKKTISVGLDAGERADEEDEDKRRGITSKKSSSSSSSASSSGSSSSKGSSAADAEAAKAKAAKEAEKKRQQEIREKEEAKEYSSDEEEPAIEEASGASLIDLDSMTDAGGLDSRGTDSSGQSIPKGVQLSGAGGATGSPIGTASYLPTGPGGYLTPIPGMPWPAGHPYPPGTVIDPVTGFPIFPGWLAPMDPRTGQMVGPVYNPYAASAAGAGAAGAGYAGSAGLAGAGGVGGIGVGASGIDWSNPQDPSLSLLGVTQDVSAAVRDLVASQKKTDDVANKPGTDIEDLAAKELREAAETIEAITKQLMARPRKAEDDKSVDAPITMDDVSDAILNATQAITKAAGALLKAATNAQAERVKSGQTGAGTGAYNVDPLWSEGLISAAHYVVATTQNLVSTADNAINGQAKEETLVASARAVSAATTQLVTAQRAKSASGSTNTQNLEDCAKGINKATSQLVQIAAQFTSTQMQEQKKPSSGTPTKYSLTEAQKMKLEKQARILELEKQAEMARKELEDMNKANYKK